MNKNNYIPMIIMTLLMFAISVCGGEIIKPVKISASSELKFYPGHLAKFAGDGKVSLRQYWCSDFKNQTKSPHWLVFDFGSPKKFNQIRLFMHPKYNRTLMFNDFKLEYWDKGKWQTIVDKKGYITNYVKAIKSKNPSNKYSLKVPTDSPIFNFSPITSRKVRLYITKVSSHVARLHEMTVSLVKSSTMPKSTSGDIQRPKDLYCFNFGSESSVAKPGFIKITGKTDYHKTKKYGWSGSPKIIACDRTYPDDLKRDFLVSESPAVFKVKLPNGKYFLYILSGDTLFASPGVRALVNNQTLRIANNPKQQYGSEVIPVEVKSNQLEIKFKAPFLINTLIIAPQKYEKKLTLVTTDILFDPGYSSYPTKFTRVIPQTNRVRPKVSAQDAKQGYICYVPSIQQRIFPDTAPKPAQIKNVIAAAATPGESQAASFCIYAVKPLQQLKVSLTDLKSDSGKIFNKNKIDLRVVKCWPQRAGHKGSSKTWAIIPELLEQYSPQAVEKNNSRQFWLTFRVPDNTAPGKYSGTILVAAGNMPEKRIKINLQVYPFKLKTPPQTVFAMYPGMGSGKTFCSDPRQKKWDLKQLKDMQAHGMNSIVLNINAKIPLKVIIEKIKYCNSLLDLANYPPRPIPWCCRNISTKTVIAVRDAVKKNKWREILFYPVDEPFHGKRLEIAKEVYAEIKKIKGIRTYSTVYQNSVDKLGENLDIRCYAVSGAAKFDAERIRKQCRKDGKIFWWYSNGTREYPAVARFKAGFFFWKTEAEGQLYWAYMNKRGDALNDFDTTSSDHCAVYFKGEEIIPTIQWECIREGINDFKYLYTLEQAIKTAPGTKGKECAKARQLLARIRKDTVIDLNEYKKRLGSSLALHVQSIWSPEQYDLYRKEIADQIVRLSK
jgi:hypothetical protein